MVPPQLGPKARIVGADLGAPLREDLLTLTYDVEEAVVRAEHSVAGAATNAVTLPG